MRVWIIEYQVGTGNDWRVHEPKPMTFSTYADALKKVVERFPQQAYRVRTYKRVESGKP